MVWRTGRAETADIILADPFWNRDPAGKYYFLDRHYYSIPDLGTARDPVACSWGCVRMDSGGSSDHAACDH